MSVKTDLSGLPDNIILLFFENVLGKVSNVFFDTIWLILFAVPVTEFDSCRYTGTLQRKDARLAEVLIYPPNPNIKMGFSFLIII